MEEKNLRDELQDNTVTENLGENLETGETEATASGDPRDSALEALQAEVQELKDKYLRQAAEFDNFRKRTARERLELLSTAEKDLMTALLDVVDDSERAEKNFPKEQDIESLKQGISLIFNKLRNTLSARGLKPMDAVGQEFNPDSHEAITEIPAPTKELKGKIVDEVVKGYLLNDKIIRFAKVVVGK